MRRFLLAAALAGVAAASLGASAGVARGTDDLARLRQATARFRTVDDAVEAGYVQFFGCVHEPLAGSMGIHFVNAALAGDTVLDVARPEALMYEVRPNGRLALVGAEYVVFQDAWDAAHDAPPRLFGRELHLVEAPNRYGLPPFYALHAWAWKANPTGVHEDWNPAVVCTDPDI